MRRDERQATPVKWGERGDSPRTSECVTRSTLRQAQGERIKKKTKNLNSHFPSRGAEVADHTFAATGFAREADRTSMVAEGVREERPIFFGDEFSEVELYLRRVRIRRKPEPLRQPHDVRIHDYPRYPEPVPEHNVRRLSAYAR